MGLDMYLDMKMYIRYYYDHNNFETSETNLKYITYGAIYWRKANAIHNWFVDNIQEGIDDCKTYVVSVEQLKELRDLCQEVVDKAVLDEDGAIIKNPEDIAELLPTKSGFFFGSTEYDFEYLDSVKYTLQMLDKILNVPMKELQKWDFTYTVSW